MIPPCLPGEYVSHDDHVISCDNSRTDDTTSTMLHTRVTDQMDNIIDIRCVTMTPRCVTTCVHVTSITREYDVPYHVRVAIDLKINVVCNCYDHVTSCHVM